PIRPVEQLKNMAQVAARTFELSVKGKIRESKNDKRRIIAPKGVEAFDLLDAKNADRLFELGYEHTVKLNFD
ncbi:MAG: patatin, partial [Bacteroidota bacterium]|nr:patatin [Bacteroidota bacterium]MDX5430779.1 patatin [Bacteroidota bacterium]MDX5469524.1 patatin [Bacteroidota bacterium]